jgi:ABC-type transport system involved in multi-copper enzyme maturation permease subunit
MTLQKRAGTMLWYKAWRESQNRFLTAAVVLIGICAAVVLFQEMFKTQLHAKSAPLNTYFGYIYQRIYGGFARGIFLLLALVLGLGGLQRERAHGSISFTLALPVSRLRLMIVRAAVGVLQILVLCLVPVMLIPGLSFLVGESYPLSQALQFSVLWLGVGSVTFAVAFLASAIFKNEYSALAVSLVAFYVYPLAVRLPSLRRYPLHIHYIMNGTGMPYFNRQTDLLIGPLPWTVLAVMVAAALASIGLATLIIQEQDFS